MRLPQKTYGDLLPEGSKRAEASSGVPHRGKIFEINRPVPLSRPLFDGIDSDVVDSAAGSAEPETGAKSEPKGSDPVSEKSKLPLTFERLPNGWSKKAVKQMTGKLTC